MLIRIFLIKGLDAQKKLCIQEDIFIKSAKLSWNFNSIRISRMENGG